MMPMCPGKEFGIMDAAMGVVFGVGTFIAHIDNVPWRILVIPITLTIGWFGMAIYCFRFASKCKCQEVYKKLGFRKMICSRWLFSLKKKK